MALDTEDLSPDETLDLTGGEGKDFASTGEADRTALLAAVNSKNVGPQVNSTDFISHNTGLSPEQHRRYSQHSEGAGALPESTYYPAESNNIQKGSYSGSEVGSIPIYAPSALTPLGIYNQREQAVQHAAMSKMKAIHDFNEKNKAPITKNAGFQKQLNDQYYTGLTKIIDDLKKEYGSDWIKYADNDPTLRRYNSDMGAIKQQEDMMVEHAAKIHKDIADGKEVSDETKQSLNDVFDSVHYALNDPLKSRGDVLQKLNQSLSYRDSDALVNQALSKITPDVTETEGTVDANGRRVEGKHTHSEVTDERLRTEAQNLHKINPVRTEDQYFNIMRAKSGIINKNKSSNTDVSDKADGKNQHYNVNDISKEPEDINVNITQKETEKDEAGNLVKVKPGTRETSVHTTDGLTFKKPIKVSLPIGSMFIDPEAGSIPTTAKGVKDITIGKAFIAQTVDLPGSPLNGSLLPKGWEDKEEYKNVDKKHIKFTPMISGSYTSEDSEGKAGPEKTVLLPMNQAENAIANKDKAGKLVSGVPVDEFYKRAKAKNDAFHGTSTPIPAAKAPAFKVTEKAEFDAMKKGDIYTAADGKKYRKR